MSLYSREQERAIRHQRLVEDWTKSGLLQPEQRDRMLPELRVDLRRTNRFLRATLAVFGFLIVLACTGLAVVFFEDLISEVALGWVALVAAVASLGLAQMLVRRYQLYHFGVEEAVAISGAVFFAIFAALLADTWRTTLAFAGATVAAAVLFGRFNYAYAAVAATVLAPMTLMDIGRVDTTRRLLAVILLLTVFFIARERRDDHDPDYPADIYGLVQAVAWAGIYLLANLKISEWLSVPDGYRTIYWISYALIWILPLAGLFMAIRDRHRALLDVNIVLLIVTMMSNKPYLGAEQEPWDPVLFGLLLIGAAVGLRRWLASGPDGSRGGYLAERILESERDRIALAGSATVFAPGAPAATAEEPPRSFGGGASGGAGSSSRF